MQNYETFDKQLTGRCRRSRKIGNNTYLKRRGENIAVKLHDTDIITFRLSNTALLDSGGWRTVTTKARINEYAPCNLVQYKGIWYIGDWSNFNHKTAPVYFDGIIIDCATGLPVGEPKTIDMKEHKAILKQCKEYAELVANSCPIDQSSDIDCLICQTEETDVEHILNHIKDKFIMSTLIYRACNQSGISIVAKTHLYGKSGFGMDDIAKRQISSAVYRYLKMQFGIAS